MPSLLSYPTTEGFRKTLIAKNLKPYTVPGVYTPNVNNVTYEVELGDLSVVDSPDELISKDPYADILYPLNAYGPLGGYIKDLNVGNLAGTKSNLGPYDVMDAKLPKESLPYERKIPTQNVYSPIGQQQIYSVSDSIFNSNPRLKNKFQPYFDPWSFVPSNYSTIEMYLEPNPIGSNGTLAQDSYIVQLGAKELQKLLRDNNFRDITYNLSNKNSGFVNGVANGGNDLLRGNTNYLNTTFKITVDTSPNNINGNYINRLSGTYYPASPIPGDYFQDELYTRFPASVGQISNSLNISNTIGTLTQYIGPKVIRTKTPSEVFLDNTGSGQSSQLFRNLNYNKYKPNYKRNILLDVAQGVVNVLGVSPEISLPSNYYVGSSIQDPKYVESPLGEVPFDSIGRDTESIVYGPDKMSKLFDNNQTDRLKFGLNGSAFEDGAGLSGGLVWVSPKYSNVGYTAGRGGDQGPAGYNRFEVISKVQQDLSINTVFRDNSILNVTQRLVDSTPRGGKRLSHVGNAINQLSKVFNDGYKEITKGSKVLSYYDVSNSKVGEEYCRVFTKDVPYYTYRNLQKTAGNIRQSPYSVLSNTYNLNIAPIRGNESTNIQNGRVTKYMFSIENLAWRTAGNLYQSLPACERGPNGGRIMWFPPYNLSFSETTSPTFKSTDYLGRPEPIYTYVNTTRTGSLSWSIIVDHPSILNLIVNRDLKNLTDTQINSIVESFFAGCATYSLYDLAQKYPNIPQDELDYYQNLINDSTLADEDAVQVGQATPVQPTSVTNNDSNNLQQFIGLGYYFDNDDPNPNSVATTTTSNYGDLYNNYINNQPQYVGNAPTTTDKNSVDNFFNQVISYNYNENENLLNNLYNIFENNKTFDGLNTTANIDIALEGSASPPRTQNYNQTLSERRVNSVVNYITNWNNGALRKYINSGNLKLTTTAVGEYPTDVNPKVNGTSLSFNGCNDATIGQSEYDRVYSPKAMACRRVAIKNINVNIPPPAPEIKPKQQKSLQEQTKQNVTKLVLRNLLSECNYFNYIFENDPMYYDSFKKKIQHFNPAFHSMTPEGLNSRLTFLNQCAKPGNTIPNRDERGNELKSNNAVNTNFGVPPVLVLRIGDFYNTKIIPTSIQFQYEPVLDINPEGIGVQPMIAKVTLAFNFVGGSGLEGPISKLQNALSFNYYANTELYDERAEAPKFVIPTTIENSNIDTVKQSQQQGAETTNDQVQLQNNGGTTVGSRTNQSNPPTTVNNLFTTTPNVDGTISYKNIMDLLLLDGQTYMNSTYNKIQEITREYNFQVYKIFASNRNYVSGTTREFTTPMQLKIFGKAQSFENKILTLVDLINQDIDNVTSSTSNGLNYIRVLYQKRYSNSVIKKVKDNLKSYVNSVQFNIINLLTNVNNELTNAQQNLVRDFAKIDVIDTQTDGFINSAQNVVTYSLIPTNQVQQPTPYTDTYDEMFLQDYSAVTTTLMNFYNDLVSNGLLELSYNPNNLTRYSNLFANSNCCGEAEKRFFTVMSKTILNNDLFIKFINDIIPIEIANSNAGGQTLLDFTKTYFSTKKIEYKYEYDAEQKFVNNFKTTSNYLNYYKVFTPYPIGKERVFDYVNCLSPSTTVKTRILNLYKNGNSNINQTTFNGKNQFN